MLSKIFTRSAFLCVVLAYVDVADFSYYCVKVGGGRIYPSVLERIARSDLASKYAAWLVHLSESQFHFIYAEEANWYSTAP